MYFRTAKSLFGFPLESFLCPVRFITTGFSVCCWNIRISAAVTLHSNVLKMRASVVVITALMTLCHYVIYDINTVFELCFWSLPPEMSGSSIPVCSPANCEQRLLLFGAEQQVCSWFLRLHTRKSAENTAKGQAQTHARQTWRRAED